MKRFSKATNLTLAGVMLVTLAACSSGSAPSKDVADSDKKVEADKKEAPQVPVEITLVSKGDINAIYTNTTSLEAEQEAIVVAKSSEIINEIFVEEGDRVERGQILAKLDTRKLELELKRSAANLARLKAELERNKRIYEKKMVSSDVYERLKFDYEAQKAAYDLAKLEYEYGTITAPIDGVVSQRMVKKGNMVKLNDSLFKITDFDPLLAVVHVPENELLKFSKGQPALVRVDANQEGAYQGEILRISPTVDAASGTFKVTVEVSDPNNTLRPGMFGRVGIIHAQHRDTLLIDKSALLSDEKNPTVYKIVDGKAVKQVIETGFENADSVEVLAGLTENDQVVIAGQNSLKNLSSVEVLNKPLTQTKVAGVNN